MSREEARAQIEGGHVLVDGAPAGKPSRLVGPGQALVLASPAPRFVGRGGHKLEAALDRFGVDPTGRRSLDAGASTGGFTDCLLQRGASQVVAVDVGHGQLHERLRRDPRVDLRERTNIRNLDLAALDDRSVDLVVADLSFISLRAVLDALLGVCRPGADLVLLVKPQFEAGRREADRGGGVIRDPAVWSRVLAEVDDALVVRGGTIMGWMASPIRGADGNAEFLVHVRAPGGAIDAPAPAATRERAVAEAAGEAPVADR